MKIDWTTPEDVKNTNQSDFPELWAESKRLLPTLTDEDIRKVVALVVSTCPYCYANDRSCCCWNDD
jgi:hypothetical protein